MLQAAVSEVCLDCAAPYAPKTVLVAWRECAPAPHHALHMKGEPTLVTHTKKQTPARLPGATLQAACEMITTAGGRLHKSEKSETRRKLEDVMKTLEKLAGEKALASRIRFVIKDVLVSLRGEGKEAAVVRIGVCCLAQCAFGNVVLRVEVKRGPPSTSSHALSPSLAISGAPLLEWTQHSPAMRGTHAALRLATALPPQPPACLPPCARQDLRRSNWVPRREVFTAKKLDEVRAQAEAELGMISSTIAATLPTLPAQQRMGERRGARRCRQSVARPGPCGREWWEGAGGS